MTLLGNGYIPTMLPWLEIFWEFQDKCDKNIEPECQSRDQDYGPGFAII